ncbi:MAG: GNAT family N-acetyltransferase [Actinomycetales bacterium]|nr:GNAT family N-acetyltransferase [Actinomycetales bacterium]
MEIDDGRGPRCVLRPLRRQDQPEWDQLRRGNAAYLSRWEPTSPDGQAPRIGFPSYVRALNRDARTGTLLPFALEVDGVLAGQVHLFGITRGSLQSGAAGYWLGQEFAGRGITTRALAALIDHALGPVGLHRVEVNIRPENAASLAVVDHLRLREEGRRERFLHIEGEWRDHRSFALTVEETRGRPVIERWVGRSSGRGADGSA